MKRSLAELDLGLKGDLTMSEPMEKLMQALATDTVPGMKLQSLLWRHDRVVNQGAGEIWHILL